MRAADEVHLLAKARLAARAEKNFALSDQLRDQISALGFDVVDVAGSYELRARQRFPTYLSSRDVKAINTGRYEMAIAMVVDGFIEDVVSSIKSIKKNSDCAVIALCVVDPGLLVDELDERTQLIQLTENPGWGECANSLLKNVTSKYLVIMDPSTRFTSDAISPVLEVLKQGEYNAVGWRGGLVNLEDEWRSVDDKGPGEVDVLFSYFMALNREEALSAGGFNNRALYYRNADMEFSLKLRHANGRLLQMDLPLEQGRHHGYYDADPDYREIQSKKNYDRILERFRGKEALLSPRR